MGKKDTLKGVPGFGVPSGLEQHNRALGSGETGNFKDPDTEHVPVNTRQGANRRFYDWIACPTPTEASLPARPCRRRSWAESIHRFGLFLELLVFFAETFDPACRVNELLFACEERMAF
jgi:hypothetical protein